MNLIIDIGNTRTKMAWFDDDKMVKQTHLLSKSINIETLLEQNSDNNIIVSTVNKKIDKSINSKSVFLFDLTTPLPILSLYKSSTIGMDRLAAAVGAFSHYPSKDCLIIDLGSAITIDFLSSKAVFEGGNISPGLSIRFKSLNNFTNNLPLVDSVGEINLTSKTSEDAIRSGVVNGILFELKMYIDLYKIRYPKLQVILTGGDSIFFANQLKNRIFANNSNQGEIEGRLIVDIDLVLNGLNTILKRNVNKA